MSPGTYTRRLYLAENGPVRALLRRGTLVGVILLLAWLMLWATRDGLKDNGGHPLGPLDVLYFAVVTVTTLGYGDIVPVSPMARGIITFGITPLRVVVWVLLLTTAYEFVLRRSIERFEMLNLKRTLKGHVVICGFGVKGRSAAKELLERGTPPGQIIIIDQSPAALEEASRLGLNFLLGNAATEQILRDAAIEKAGHAILVPNNDEACVLICLTIRELAPKVSIRAAAREEENVKLIRRSGANTVVAPSVSGGRLLASATSSPWSTDVVEELFEHGRGADLYDVPVKKGDVGLTAGEVGAREGFLVLAVHTHADEMLGFRDALHRPLEAGDTMIAFAPARPETESG